MNLNFRLTIFVFLLVVPLPFVIGCHSSMASSFPEGELHELWEISIPNSNSYRNAFDFDEIEVEAVFISPENKQFKVSGFYDGDGLGAQTGSIWKVRFYPSEVGRWQFRYEWSDGTPGDSGSFLVREKKDPLNHGHVGVDPDHPKYLIHDDGTPHYWWGANWISAPNYGPEAKNGLSNPRHVPDSDFSAYLDLLKKYRHNGVLINIALYPLEDDKITWDLAWVKRLERLMDQLKSRHIYVQLNIFNTWSRRLGSFESNRLRSKIEDLFFDKNVWDSETDGRKQVFNVWEAGEEKAKRNYIKTVISRFAGYPNVYWELGNEMGHDPNPGDSFISQANENYIPWIREYDPYDLPIGLSEYEWEKADVDIGFIHQSHKFPEPSATKPIIMNELVRGGIRDVLWKDSTIRDSSNRLAYRRTFWRMFTHGGCGSSTATWLRFDVDLNQAVLDVMGDQFRFRQVIESLPVNINETFPEGAFLLAGPGDFSTRAKTGEIYLTYFLLEPNESRGKGPVTLSLPEGTYRLTWIDPSTGEIVVSDRVESNGGELDTTHPPFEEDIVLIVLFER